MPVISASAAQAQYLWPTNASTYLSATFGETRSAHFHAALDIKTWGQEGYKVMATRDGWVYRLLTTERGYGKAVYLKHDDESYSLYAHMQRFNEELSRIADSVRIEQDLSFQLDHLLIEDSIRVKQGEIIGFTGSTGIGPPHLHFELRDKDQAPVNPLRKDLEITDSIAPIFSSLLIEPLTPGSAIDGSAHSKVVRPGILNGIYDFGIIRISGTAGFAINAYDMADRVTNKYAVYSLLLKEGQDTLFYEKLDRFSYEDEEQMFMDRAAPFPNGKRGYQRLFQKDGGKNPFVIKNDDNSWISPDDTERTYEIIAEDFYGNTARGKVRVVRGDDPREVRDLSGLSDMSSWYWDNDWISFTGKEYLNVEKELPGIKIDQTESIYDLHEVSPIQFYRAVPGKRESIHSFDRKMTITLPATVLFDTTSIALKVNTNDPGGIRISLQPEMIPLRHEFHLSYYLGGNNLNADHTGLYRISSEDGELSYVDSYVLGNTLHASPSQLGEFVVKKDTDPPQIRSIRVYQTSWGMWQVSARVTDAMSGINSGSALFKVNGKRGIAEYDYEEDLLIYYLPGFRPEETNQISIRVEDKAGNSAEAEVSR
ncbi:M23 family metallopeptidase [Gracilimonas aurantiaca]|uniref:M23 family metallopeptidase n=1 Tax=Gracilimonas aurantiaca TaxID=3234185 RepID=UPI00390CACEA